MPWSENHPATAPSAQSGPWAGAGGATGIGLVLRQRGIYNITQPEMSQKLLRRKMANIATTGAEVVASANPGCSVQLQAAVRESNLKLKVAHPISLLAEAYRSAKLTSSQQSLDALSG